MEIKKAGIKPFLFENIGTKQTIFKNTFWLTIAEGVSRFFELILFIYIIRILGAVEYGKLAFALAFVSLFAVFSDFGLSDITTRELSRNKEVERDYPAILSLKVILCLGTLVLILISSFFITADVVVRFTIWLLGIFVLVNDFFFIIYSFLRARQKMEYEAGAKILRILILVPVIFFVLFNSPSVKNISYGYLFANLVALVLVLLFFNFRIQLLKLTFDRIVWKKFFKLSWPLGLAVIFGGVFISIDSVMMGYFGQIAPTGYYNTSRKIVGAIVIPATFIFMSFYPLLSKLFQESKEKLQAAWNYYMESMIVFAVPLMVGGVVLAPKIIDFIFGTNFSPSILVFQILIFMAGINFIYNPYILILIVSGQQKKYLLINLVGALINIFLNLILIPRYSLYGASLAAVITYIVLLFLGIEFSRRFTPILPFNLKLFRVLIIVFLSSLTMFTIINQPLIYNLNTVFTTIIGAAVYFSVFFFFRKIFFNFGLLPKI